MTNLERMTMSMDHLRTVYLATRNEPLDFEGYALSKRAQAIYNIKTGFNSLAQSATMQTESAKAFPENPAWERQAGRIADKAESLLSAFDSNP